MQFYIEAGVGFDAFYALQEGPTTHWSIGFDASDNGNLKINTGFGVGVGKAAMTIRKSDGVVEVLQGLHVITESISGLHRDVATHRDVIIEGASDCVMQIASDNSGSVGTGIVLTNQENTTDGRHWVIQHGGSSGS